MKQSVLTFSILFVLGLVAVVACTNPFTTRAGQVEEPETGEVEYLSPNEPENVLKNLLLAIKNKNLTEYMNCFSPADLARFKFEPEPFYLNEFLTRGWTLSDEEDYFDQLRSSVLHLNFSWQNGDEPILHPVIGSAPNDSVESVVTPYSMLVAFDIDSARTYEGTAFFKLYHDQGTQKWHIYYWKDKALNDTKVDKTITALKFFYNKKSL